MQNGASDRKQGRDKQSRDLLLSWRLHQPRHFEHRRGDAGQATAVIGVFAVIAELVLVAILRQT